MTGSSAYLDAAEARRTHYALSAESTVSDDDLFALVQRAVKHTPTAFNSQSSRAVLVLGDSHRQLWDVIFAEYQKSLGDDADRIERNKTKFDSSYKGGYGTVVFFEDTARIAQYAEKSPDFAALFPVWSANSTGMLQHIVWTALSAEGLGANLQHYGQVNKDIEASIRTVLDVPETWVSTALMPFGRPTGAPGGAWGKSFEPIEGRVKRVG